MNSDGLHYSQVLNKSFDAEQRLITAMLCYPDQIPEAQNILVGPEDFTTTDARIVYGALVRVAGESTAIEHGQSAAFTMLLEEQLKKPCSDIGTNPNSVLQRFVDSDDARDVSRPDVSMFARRIADDARVRRDGEAVRRFQSDIVSIGEDVCKGRATLSKFTDAASDSFHSLQRECVNETEFKAYRPSELCDIEGPDWIVPDFIPSQSKTLITGMPKGGKSTFAAHLIKTAESGGGFIGRRVERLNVLIVSEESQRVWKQRVTTLELGENLTIVPVPFIGKPDRPAFRRLVQWAAMRCETGESDIVIFDTYSRLFPIEDEGDSSQNENAMAELDAIIKAGGTPIILHHNRKAGGEYGLEVRGSNAIVGAVDVALSISRMQNAAHGDTRRVLKAVSRFDETPEETVIELRPGIGYVEVGSVAQARSEDVCETIRSILAEAGEAGMYRDDIRAAWPEGFGIPSKPGDSALAVVLKNGAESSPPKWHRVEEQTRGKPYRYHSIDSFSPPLHCSANGTKARETP